MHLLYLIPTMMYLYQWRIRKEILYEEHYTNILQIYVCIHIGRYNTFYIHNFNYMSSILIPIEFSLVIFNVKHPFHILIVCSFYFDYHCLCILIILCL